MDIRSLRHTLRMCLSLDVLKERSESCPKTQKHRHGEGDDVTLSPNRHDRLQGWAVSAIVHGLALTVALGLMTQVKPVVPKESFTWDVALVEPQRTQEASQAEIAPAQEPAKPTPRSITPA